jgi:predicted transcriptional regulator
VSSITGIVRISGAIFDSEINLLDKVSPTDALLPAYKKYLNSAKSPCALILENPHRFEKAFSISFLGSDIRAPQSYRYINLPKNFDVRRSNGQSR